MFSKVIYGRNLRVKEDRHLFLRCSWKKKKCFDVWTCTRVASFGMHVMGPSLAPCVTPCVNPTGGIAAPGIRHLGMVILMWWQMSLKFSWSYAMLCSSFKPILCFLLIIDFTVLLLFILTVFPLLIGVSTPFNQTWICSAFEMGCNNVFRYWNNLLLTHIFVLTPKPCYRKQLHTPQISLGCS